MANAKSQTIRMTSCTACKKYNADNVLIQQSTYQHGQLQGETRRFYQSGQLLQITNYQQGQPVGEEFYFYDGQVKTGPLRSWQNWKLIKPADPNAHCDPQDEEDCTPAGKPRPVSILFGEQREYAENGRLTSLSYQAGRPKKAMPTALMIAANYTMCRRIITANSKASAQAMTSTKRAPFGASHVAMGQPDLRRELRL